MKVFISWSGRDSASHTAALALQKLLPMMYQPAKKPFISSDIDAGSRWQADVMNELASSNFGILCVTAQNQKSAWLNFEAGALSKVIQMSRVVPLAIGMKITDIELPLAQFQAKSFSEDGLLKTVLSLDRASEDPLGEEVVRSAVSMWWPKLEAEMASARHDAGESETPPRSDRDLLEEILDNVRGLGRGLFLFEGWAKFYDGMAQYQNLSRTGQRSDDVAKPGGHNADNVDVDATIVDEGVTDVVDAEVIDEGDDVDDTTIVD